MIICQTRDSALVAAIYQIPYLSNTRYSAKGMPSLTLSFIVTRKYMLYRIGNAFYTIAEGIMILVRCLQRSDGPQ